MKLQEKFEMKLKKYNLLNEKDYTFPEIYKLKELLSSNTNNFLDEEVISYSVELGIFLADKTRGFKQKQDSVRIIQKFIQKLKTLELEVFSIRKNLFMLATKLTNSVALDKLSRCYRDIIFICIAYIVVQDDNDIIPVFMNFLKFNEALYGFYYYNIKK